MPRYFFNVHDGISIEDHQGTEFDTIDEAKSHALRVSATMLTAHPKTFWNGEQWEMSVCDSNRVFVFGLLFTGLSPRDS